MHAGLEIQAYLLGHRGQPPARSVSPGEHMTLSNDKMNVLPLAGDNDVRGTCLQNPSQRV